MLSSLNATTAVTATHYYENPSYILRDWTVVDVTAELIIHIEVTLD